MRVTSFYARLIVALRWPVLLAVVAGAWAATSMLPGIGSGGGGGLSVAGSDAAAIQAQQQAVQRFGLPLLARTVVVQRDPNGLNPYTAARSVLLALEVDKRSLTAGPQPGQGLLGALPLINYSVVVPSAQEHGTTAVTYLFADPSLGLGAQDRIAHDYADRIYGPDAAVVGVTGTIPELVEQGQIISRWMPLVEAATLVAIAVLVGWHFRSVVAPFVTLATAGVGYLLADRVVGLLAASLGFTAPDQLRPVIVALMLGVTTDYSILFLSGLQRRVRSGETNPEAARAAIGEYLPIVLTAGLTVACALGSLIVADFALFRAFGPGLAVTVLVGLAVALTVVPALMAALGRWVFWPSRVSTATPADRAPARTGRWIRRLEDRRVAGAVVVLLTVVLVAAAWPVTGARSAVAPMDELPAGNPVREAAAAAAAGFTPGIIAPTEVVVSAPGLAGRGDALARLGAALDRQAGVDIVLGAGDRPVPLDQPLGLFVAPGGGAVRYLVAFDSDPLGATAIGHLRALQDGMPRLLADAGLAGAEVDYAGDTALGASLVEHAQAALGQVAVGIALVILALLVLYLRALVAPLYLLVTSVLAVAAALGLTTLLFERGLGHDGLTFYVPFTAAVLLVSLGNDYNIFSVGSVFQEAQHRPLREALAAAVPRSTRAITAAGLALAVSFALVALIPLSTFRELAFAVAVGVLIDAVLVRTVLVPALISLIGPASGWPGKRLGASGPPAARR